MARDLMQIHRGNKNSLPNLTQGELGWVFDTNELYIGDDSGNVRIHQGDLLNVKWFGVKGDGVTDDTVNLINAFETAITENMLLYFPKGDYLIKKDSVPSEKIVTNNVYGEFIKTSSMIGYDAKLIIDGLIGFETSFVENLIVRDLNFELINGYGTDIDGINNNVFYHDDVQTTKTRLYENLNFNGLVDLSDGSQRYGMAIHEKCIEKGYFNNIKTNNLAGAIRVYEGENFTIENVYSYNYQTCIYTIGNANGVKNYTVNNIHAENTFEQSQIWLDKNNPTDPDDAFNGMDLILCDGDNYNLSNLNAINPIERCIYSQGSNVKANNLKCVNGDGFKFVGQGYDDIKKNIKVDNLLLLINEDIVNDSIQTNVSLSQLYWIEDVKITNGKIVSTDNVTGTPVLRVFPISRHTKNIIIKDIDVDVWCGDSLIYPNLRSEDGLTTEEYIVCENLIVDNCHIKKDNRREGSLLYPRSEEASVGALATYALRNVTIKNCYIEYGSNPDDFWYDYSWVDGFYATNNSANKRCNWQSGLDDNPDTPTDVYNNIVLIEKDIHFSTTTNLLDALKNLKLTQGSQLELIKRLDDNRLQKFKCEVYNSVDTPIDVYYNSYITLKIFLIGYESIDNMPDTYTIEVSSPDGYYLGEVSGTTLSDLIGTSPITFDVSTANSIVIRGDTYDKQATVTIKATPYTT